MRKQAHILLKGNSDIVGYNFAISKLGDRIAIRYIHLENYDYSPPNIYIYDTIGQEIFSFVSSHGGEQGLAFWPDNDHIITTGCGHPENWDADGIKQWKVGNKKFQFLFANTPLTGLNLNLLGVTPQGRYIIGSRIERIGYRSEQRQYILDTFTENTVRTLYINGIIDWIVFSQNDKYIGVAKDMFMKMSKKRA